MKVVDDVGLPRPLLAAMGDSGNEEKIEPHDYRVSELIESPRISQLKRIHWAKLESPASQGVWMLVGTAVHALIEKHAFQDPSYRSEQRIYATINGVIVTGKIDLQELSREETSITDWKYTSAFSLPNHLKKWEEQLNCYAFLYHQVWKRDPAELVVIAFYRDWSAYDAKQSKAYPQKAIEKHSLPIWPLAIREAFLKDRIQKHLDAWAGAEMDELPLCTDEERWLDKKVYVRKNGLQRPVKTCSSREEARSYIDSKKSPFGLYIVEAKPVPRRCKGNWCRVAEFCEQYQNELRNEPEENSPQLELETETEGATNV